MPVWKPGTVADEPEVVLTSWHVFEVANGDRHFCGWNVGDREGRVSSRIVEFDASAMTGRTRSGRVYRLSGRPGTDGDALYVRARWLRINGFDPEVRVLPADEISPGPALLQEWHGYVVEVGEGRFLARLLDVTSGDTVEGEEAEIPVGSVPEAERHLVKPGAYFRWTIRDGDGPAASIIDFASTPAFTEEDVARAKERARALREGIAWE